MMHEKIKMILFFLIFFYINIKVSEHIRKQISTSFKPNKQPGG
jgi:hypothetical protein